MSGGDVARVDGALDQLLIEHPPASCSEQEFWGAQFDLGLAWVRFPEGLGGLNVHPSLQTIVTERIRSAGGSFRNWDRNVVGLGMGGPTVLALAPPDLQKRLLRPMFTCEEIWCQLFSEPGSGSDVASVATSASPDDGEWVVSGQKVWTTLAHEATWGLLLARTDPTVPKHQGLTYFLVNMRSPGIDVRPIYELTGEAEFNEVFLSEVRIPDVHRLSEVGNGWRAAMTTLMNERVAVGGEIGQGGSDLIDVALQTWKSGGPHSRARQDVLMKVWVRAQVLRINGLRAEEAATLGTPGPEGSISKLMWAELNQDVHEVALDQLSAAGMLYPDGYLFERPTSSSVNAASPWKAFLRSRANTIEGGTSEIMRDVIAERTLGLPPEPRPDRDMAWRDVPRN